MGMGSRLIVVDVRDVIESYVRYEPMYELYRHYPLKDIISTLLTGEVNYQEVIWFDLEERISCNTDILDRIDVDAVDLFFEGLTMDLDKHISDKLGMPYEHVDCSFSRWLDNTSLILSEV